MPSIGFSLFLIAAGAILRYAVTASVEGVSLTTVGLILMIIGIVGLVISLLFVFAWSPRHSRNAHGGVDGERPYGRPPGSF
jgi:heme/copper-type cytochrome/quinol oxidase subunit 2